MPNNRGLPVSDDEILDWWEYYLQVRRVSLVAEHFNRAPATIQHHLKHLGVFEETPPQRPKVRVQSNIDKMVERILEGDWTESETRIAVALRKIAYADDTRYNPHLPVADALEHVKRKDHPKIVMSKRQRSVDAMATANWRRQVRGELAAAGLVMGVWPSGPHYFT